MVLKTLLATAGALVVLATTVEAQATLTPSFNAPHRPFVRSEFGGIVSFPDPGGTAYEGVYRLGARRMDLGLRGGILDRLGVTSGNTTGAPAITVGVVMLLADSLIVRRRNV